MKNSLQFHLQNKALCVDRKLMIKKIQKKFEDLQFSGRNIPPIEREKLSKENNGKIMFWK